MEDEMIRDKIGTIPLGAAEMTPAELAPLLVGLQLQRVELTEVVDGLRSDRDDLSSKMRFAKSAAEARGEVELANAKGKVTAVALRAFVASDGVVRELKKKQEASAREMAHADDSMGSVRSGIRVLLSLVHVARERAESAVEAEEVASVTDGDW